MNCNSYVEYIYNSKICSKLKNNQNKSEFINFIVKFFYRQARVL